MAERGDTSELTDAGKTMAWTKWVIRSNRAPNGGVDEPASYVSENVSKKVDVPSDYIHVEGVSGGGMNLTDLTTALWEVVSQYAFKDW